jgi:DNA modification methylase
MTDLQKTKQDIINKVYCGDAYTELITFPSNSVDLIVTSPPYYKLRNYQHKDQIGQEATPHKYLENLKYIFTECKRVLKSTGSIYVVIADCYNKHKSLVGIPERFAIMMEDDLDLIRRNTIIWEKNALPESPNDRYSNNFEYVYFFTKSEEYYHKLQYQPYAESSLKQYNQTYLGKAKKDYEGNKVQNPSDTKRRIITSIKFGGNKYPNSDSVNNNTYSGNQWEIDTEKGARKKCIWKISTNNSTEEHYASYPEELIETPINASSPIGGLVLDPFLGSGTTAIKAQKMNRKYVGIELNPKYVSIAKSRLNNMISSYIIRE